jgi:hypothetical protein
MDNEELNKIMIDLLKGTKPGEGDPIKASQGIEMPPLPPMRGTQPPAPTQPLPGPPLLPQSSSILPLWEYWHRRSTPIIREKPQQPPALSAVQNDPSAPKLHSGREPLAVQRQEPDHRPWNPAPAPYPGKLPDEKPGNFHQRSGAFEPASGGVGGVAIPGTSVPRGWSHNQQDWGVFKDPDVKDVEEGEFQFKKPSLRRRQRP